MQNLRDFKEPKMPNGMNNRYRPEDLPSGFCELAQNCFLSGERINERTGYSMIANDLGGTDGNLCLFPYEKASGVKTILKIENVTVAGSPATIQAGLHVWTGTGNWTLITTSYFTKDLQVMAVQAADAVYFFNGTDSVKKWDGTTLSIIAAIPKGKYAEWFHNFLFVAGDNTYPNRVYYSDLGAPETFGGSDYIDINPDDGDYINGIKPFYNTLLFGKGNRVWGLTGYSTASFAISSMSDTLTSYGTSAGGSMVNIGNDLLFLSPQGDTPHIRSIKRTSFGELTYGSQFTTDIEGTMKTLSKAYLYKTKSIFDGINVWFFIANGSSTYNDYALCYDVVEKGWTVHTGIYAANAIISTISGEPRVYFADSRNSKVYEMDDSYDDDGATIDFQFKSRTLYPDLNRKIKWKYLTIHGERVGDVNVGVYISVEGGDFTLVDTVNFKANGTVFPLTFPSFFGNQGTKSQRINLGYDPAYSIQIKLTKNDILTPIEIHEYKFAGYAKGIRAQD